MMAGAWKGDCCHVVSPPLKIPGWLLYRLEYISPIPKCYNDYYYYTQLQIFAVMIASFYVLSTIHWNCLNILGI
jgi:hypothetical protein